MRKIESLKDGVRGVYEVVKSIDKVFPQVIIVRALGITTMQEHSREISIKIGRIQR